MTVPEIFARIVKIHQEVMSGELWVLPAKSELDKLAAEGKKHKLNLDPDAIYASIIEDRNILSDAEDNSQDTSYEEETSDSW